MQPIHESVTNGDVHFAILRVRAYRLQLLEDGLRAVGGGGDRRSAMGRINAMDVAVTQIMRGWVEDGIRDDAAVRLLASLLPS